MSPFGTYFCMYEGNPESSDLSFVNVGGGGLGGFRAKKICAACMTWRTAAYCRILSERSWLEARF